MQVSQPTTEAAPAAPADMRTISPATILEKMLEVNKSFDVSQTRWKPSRSHWVWLFISVDHECLVCQAFGIHRVIASDGTTNASKHVATHGILESGECCKERQRLVAAPRERTLGEVARTHNDRIVKLDEILAYGIPLHRVRCPIYRKANQCLAADFQAHKAQVFRHAKMRVTEVLTQLAGRTVTLAIDGGTVWNHYLAICVLAWGCPGLLVAIPRCDGSMNAAWIADQVRKVTRAALAPHGIKPICVVSDNASNMTAAIREAGATLPLVEARCLIHTIQLVVNDFFAKESMKVGTQRVPAEDVWARVQAVMDENNLPAIPVTRWNNRFKNLRRIRDDADIAVPDNELFTAVTALTGALEIYYDATMALQSNQSSMVQACAVAHKLLFDTSLDARTGGVMGVSATLRNIANRPPGARTSPSRLDKIMSPVLIIVAYFHPALQRRSVANLKPFVQRLVGNVADALGCKEQALAQFRRIHYSRPQEGSQVVSGVQYKEYWKAVNGAPDLAAAICAAAMVNPSEADCERKFSTLKLQFNKLRTTAGPDLVEYTLTGGSAVHCLHRTMPSEDGAEVLPLPSDPTLAFAFDKFTSQQAEDLLKLYYREVVKPQEEEAARQRRAVVNDKICDACGEEAAELWPGRALPDWMGCDYCGKWWHNVCIDVDPFEIDELPQPFEWFCPGCVTAGNTTAL